MPDGVKQPAKGGRPTLYSEELADRICVRLMDGESLRSICRDDDMPAISTVMLWVLNHKEFETKYNLARKVQAEVDFDDIREIADTPEIGEKTVNRDGKLEVTKGDMVEHRRLRVDARKWRLARMDPKRYGDRVQQEHSGPDGGPIEINDVSLTDTERAERVARLLDAARARAAGQTADASEDLGAAAGTADGGVRE